jgi:methionyl-tRNA synthetase
MARVSDSLYHTHFRAAITQAFALAQECNRYLDTKAPWISIRTDQQAAATTLVVAIRVINCLKVLLYPFLPFTSQRLHEFLGLNGKVEQEKWDFDYLVEAIQPGNGLRQPQPLYTKLDPQLVEEETQRLGGQVV